MSRQFGSTIYKINMGIEKHHFIPEDMRGEITLRVNRIQEIMKRSGVEALLLTGNANVFYTSGRFFRGYTYIPLSGEAIYFIMRPDIYDTSSVRSYTIRKPEQIPSVMEENAIALPATVGYEYDDLSFSEVKRLQAVFPDATAADGGAVMREARMRKTPYEIGQMEADGLHQAAVYRRIPRVFKEDMTDVEFQIEIEHILRMEGCLGRARMSGSLMEINMGSVLYGENADAPTPYEFALGGAGTDPSLPVGADGSIMHSGHTVMVDMNGAFNGYQTDMTRVWRIGDIPEKAVKAHDCSRKILRRLEEIGKPGCPVADLYNEAMRIVEEEKLERYFMGHTQRVAFIGHGVGIELNEQPPITGRSKVLLAEGMTLAIEPKFVIPGVGAVGVENTYVVTDRGLRCLTPFEEEIQEL